MLRDPLAGRREQRPAAGEGQQPRLPPALAQPEVEACGAADQAVEQHAPRVGVVGRADGAHAEIAGGDDERREAPAAAGGHEPQAGRHAGQVEQQQVGVGRVPTQQHRREEGAQRGSDPQRLDVDGVGDHRQPHRHQRQADDARGGRQHLVQPGGRPDAEIDDARARADERRAVGAVARLEPPAERADGESGRHPAGAAQDRRDPAALEGKLQQVPGGHQQRHDAYAEEDPLADPALRQRRHHARGGRPGRARGRRWTTAGRLARGRGRGLRGRGGWRRAYGGIDWCLRPHRWFQRPRDTRGNRGR